MMKLFMLVSFMLGMVFFNLVNMFYMNLCYVISGIMIFSILSMWGTMGMGVFSSGYFVCDKYSSLMIMLSSWIIGLMFMSLSSDEEEESHDFFKKVVFMIMLGVLSLFFSVSNFLGLYLFFEVSLIPTYFMVVYWGSSYERIEASFYLMIYMIFISFPLLIYVMKMYDLNCSLDMSLSMVPGVNKFMNLMMKWEYIVVLGAFIIKFPVFLFHVWLPKAHVEAPVFGSMLLAAVLLKLGSYGLLRVLFMFGEGCVSYSCFVVSLGMVGGVYMSIMCIIQVDMKSLVAYSSVVHMNMMLAGLFTMEKIGFVGGLIMMVSHGLCSSGLFYMVNAFYKRSLSRLMILNNGMSGVLSTLMLWWFLLCVSNFSFPFSLNFMGELYMVMTLVSWDFSISGLIGLVCFFSGAYSLYMFSSIFHGESDLSSRFNESFMVEHLSGLLHYSPLMLGMLSLHLFI